MISLIDQIVNAMQKTTLTLFLDGQKSFISTSGIQSLLLNKKKIEDKSS